MIVQTGLQDARAVANYFLDAAKAEGRMIDPMGIQKLVYFANGWHLAMYGRPLILQPVEAWEYGPVIRDLNQDFKRFGNNPITQPALTFHVDPDTLELQYTKPEISPLTAQESVALLKRVWEVYRPFTSIQLSNMTLTPGSPWKVARDHGQ
jgi:uncharacterized phage-associated protein